MRPHDVGALLHARPPEGVPHVMATDVRRCTRSDLPPDMCSHCRGEDPAIPSIDVAQAPRPVRERWRPDTLTVEPAPPARPSKITPTYPLLCAAARTPADPDSDPTPACRPEADGGPRRTGGRSHLCDVCEDRTRDRWLSIADAWPDLEQRLVAIRSVWGNGKLTGSLTYGLGLDEPASDAMLAVGLQTHFYARIVMRERGHTPPDATPAGLARWLGKSHTPWLCAHPDRDVAVAFADDAAALWRRVRSAAYPVGARTISLPLACHVSVPVPEAEGGDEEDKPEPCPGRMTATIRPDLTHVPDLVCDTYPDHRIPPAEWQREGWKGAARNERATRRFLKAVQGS